jgi:hypothetical protein
MSLLLTAAAACPKATIADPRGWSAIAVPSILRCPDDDRTSPESPFLATSHCVTRRHARSAAAIPATWFAYTLQFTIANWATESTRTP